jgi:hypothetical protein
MAGEGGSAVNLNLFLAAIWGIFGIGLLLAPTINDSYLAGLSPQTRLWMAGFALVMVCYNIIRWRLTRMRRQADEQAYRPNVRPQRREEPPNPDFDFSDRDQH